MPSSIFFPRVPGSTANAQLVADIVGCKKVGKRVLSRPTPLGLRVGGRARGLQPGLCVGWREKRLLQAGIKYLGTYISRKEKLTSKMKC